MAKEGANWKLLGDLLVWFFSLERLGYNVAGVTPEGLTHQEKTHITIFLGSAFYTKNAEKIRKSQNLNLGSQ